MSAATRAEISRLERQVDDEFGPQIEHERRKLARAVAEPPEQYNDREVRDLRAKLERLERERAHVIERIEGLRATLPDEGTVAAAIARAQQLAEQARAAVNGFSDASMQFLESLEVAEAIARQLMARRREAAAASQQIRDIASVYGIEVYVPPVPSLDAVDAKLATHLAMLLQEIASGSEPSEVVEAYLADARLQRSLSVQRAS